MSTQSSPTLCFIAGRSACLRPASAMRSAIVREPVLASAALIVPTSIPPLLTRLATQPSLSAAGRTGDTNGRAGGETKRPLEERPHLSFSPAGGATPLPAP